MAFNLQIYEEITNLQKNIPETEFHAKLNLTFYHKYDNHKHDNHKHDNTSNSRFPFFVVSYSFYKRSHGVDIVKGDIKSFSDCASTDKCPLLFRESI